MPPGPAADDATAVAFVPPRVDGRRPLLDQVRDVVRGAAEAYADTPAADRLAEVVARLDGALRVAIAGRVKAGKSTLLNALVGQQIAATDARECTLVHTWYQDGVGYKVMLYPRQGPPRQLPFGQTGADAGVDLGDLTPAEVDRLEVDWPSHALRAMTLIDTPGMGSATAGVSERSEALLTPDDDQPPVVDAIIYLMRHVHANDLRFLQAVQGDPTLGRPMNTVGVLARADEVGHARPDALESAGRVADRYRNDPRVRRLCQTVVPVAGLLASTAATLREAEFRALRQLSALDVEQVEQLLLVAEDFGRAELPAEPDGATRTALLERFGVYGVQLAVELIRTGAVRGPTELSEVLLARSGLQALRELLTSQFAARADLLKARSALLALEGVAREFPQAGARTEWLRYALEQIRSGAHELAELDLIDALRGGLVPLPEQEVAAAERLLGVDGAAGCRRLGLSENATPDELREAAAVALTRWQQRAAHPASAGGVRDAAQVVVRTCEGLLARL